MCCQLCGVSFNINRIRTANEPREAAWGRGQRSGWIHAFDTEGYGRCSSETGCSLVYRGSFYPPEPNLYEDDPDREVLDHDPTYEHQSEPDDEILELLSDASAEQPQDVDETEEESNYTDEQQPDWTFRVSGPTPPTHDPEFLPLSTPWTDAELKETSEGYRKSWEIASKYEDIAGPNCQETQGYQGFRISVEEMRGCHVVQCLVAKGRDGSLRLMISTSSLKHSTISRALAITCLRVDGR